MFAIVSLLVVISLSLLVVRAGTLALVMTGLSEDIASFQSLSAFSGVGFTTREAEHVLSSAARRKIVRALILLGHVGSASAIGSLILSFAGSGGQAPARLLVLCGGVVTLAAVSRSRQFHRLLTPLIVRALRRATELELRDYAELLRLRGEYGVAVLNVREGEWLAGKRLVELDLPAEGITVLGVERHDGDYVGAPPVTLRLATGDRLIAYGREHRLRELSARPHDDHAARGRARTEHGDQVRQEQSLIS
jgi:hypothetical protein